MHAHNGPHDGILLLEEDIEELHAKIESCQKFILASRIAVVGGGICACRNSVRSRNNGGSGRRISRGIVAWGSNAGTAKEAAKEIVAAEADRDALIEMIDPRVIPDGTAKD